MESGVLYLDILFLTFITNMMFDWLLLWATAEVTKVKSSKWRLISAALFGSVHYTLYILSYYQVIEGYGVLRFPLTILLVSIGMIIIAFREAIFTQFIRIAGTFYIIFFISSGAGLAVGSLIGSATRPHIIISNLISVITILLAAELGWGVVQKRIWRSLYNIPIEIILSDKKAYLMTLVDTGNQLFDPVSKAPVIIVEFAKIKTLFPEELHEDLLALIQGDLEKINAFMSQISFCSRFKVIPFSSLGNEHGLLIGFKPDEVRIHNPEPTLIPIPCVIGITPRKLIADGTYQGLLPPSLLKSATEDESLPVNTLSILTDEGGNEFADIS